MGPSTVYSVPFFPAICVEVGAAAVVDGSAAADDDTDDEADDAELEVWLELFPWWQPTPISANTAIPIENDAVLFDIARISSFRILFKCHSPRSTRPISDAMPIRSCSARNRADP